MNRCNCIHLAIDGFYQKYLSDGLDLSKLDDLVFTKALEITMTFGTWFILYCRENRVCQTKEEFLKSYETDPRYITYDRDSSINFNGYPSVILSNSI